MVTLLLLACTGAGHPDADTGSPDSEASDTGDDSDTGTDSETESDSDSGADSDTGSDTDTEGETDTGPPPPVDEDGDGYLSDVDCDDGNPSIHPGATDICDGVDQDCDGDPQGAGSCGDWLRVDEAQAGAWQGEAEDDELIAKTFTSGDGGADSRSLVVRADGPPDAHSDRVKGYYVLESAIPDGAQPMRSAVRSVVTPDDWLTDIDQPLPAGDFNGDGYEDLWFGEYGCDYWTGTAWFVPGPPEDWAARGRQITDVATGAWTEAQICDGFWLSAAAGFDINGDGMDDLVELSGGDPYSPGDGGSLHLVVGRVDPQPLSERISDESTLWNDQGAEWGHLWAVALVGDLDGDGSPDVLTGAPDAGLGVISGAEFASIESAQWSDVAVQWSKLEDDSTAAGPILPSPTPGDFDGDGLDDALAVSVRPVGRDGAERCLDIVSGGAIEPAEFADRLLASACSEVTGETALNEVASDLDGDGVVDPTWGFDTPPPRYSDATGVLTCIVPTSRLVLGGSVVLDDIVWCVGDTYTQFIIGDIDGDGEPELLANDPFYDTDGATGAGTIAVIPGFAIPWDDPTKW